MLLGAALTLLNGPAWGGGASRPWWNGRWEALAQAVLCCALQWITSCQSPNAAWPRRWSAGGSGRMARPAATTACMWTSRAGAPASGRSCTPWSRTKVRCLLLPGWPWPAVPWPGRARAGCAVGCRWGRCPTGQLVGKVAKAGSLTQLISLFSALPQVLTPSWCTWPTRICTRCPTLR